MWFMLYSLYQSSAKVFLPHLNLLCLLPVCLCESFCVLLRHLVRRGYRRLGGPRSVTPGAVPAVRRPDDDDDS